MDNFDPDAYLASKQPAAPTPAQGAVPVDPLQLQQFDPSAYLAGKQIQQADQLQQQSGQAGDQLLAGVEGAARGASLGLSDVAESQLSKVLPEGLSQTFSPEQIRARQEANPTTSFLGNIAGAAPLGGLGKAIGLGGVAAEAATGALFGAGNAVSEAALGDPQLNAQKVLADVGMGAALGGGLGLLSKAIKTLPAFLRGVDEPSTLSGTAQNPVVDVQPSTGQKARSLEELNQQTENYQKYGGANDLYELPIKQEAQAAAERLAPEMPIPISDYQIDSLSSQDARNAYKTTLEVPGKNGEILRNATGAQKKSLDDILDKTIGNVAPGYEPTADAAEAGSRAADAFTDVIQQNRDQLGPAIAEIKKTPLQEMDHLPGVIDYLTNPEASPRGNPKIANMFEAGGNEIAIKPYQTSMGIDQGTYRAVKQAVNALQENPNDFEKLFDIRKGLSQNVDVTKLGDTAKEVGQAKAALMDYIQDAVQSVDPDQSVRETFANYAKNEENAKLIEQKFGAEIGSDNFRSLAKGKPEERILGKIFSDSASTQAAKNILPPEKFNELLADHLAILKKDTTDQGIFSANKFYSKIAKGTSQHALNEAFAGNPGTYQKIKDLMTVMRTFTDAAPQNPSGTTKTLLQALVNGGLDPFKHLANLTEFGKEKLNELQGAAEINAKLRGQQDSNMQLKSIQGILNRVNQTISSNVKDIFKSDALKGVTLSAGIQLSQSAYDKIAKRIGELSTNPQSAMDHLSDSTEGLHPAAPNIAQGLSTAMVQGIQFLQSKLPQPVNTFPLSREWEPNQAQLSQFSKYYAAVNEPLSSLKQVANGTLTNATMEALQAVHPALLSEMRQKVLETMNLEKAKEFAYGKRLALAKFLGQPLDESMTPQMIQASQNSFNPPASPPPPGGQKKPTQGGLKQLKASDRTRTATNEKEED